MKTLYLTSETGLINDVNFNGYYSIWLSIITVAVILSGIFVIISKNPILSVLYLIFLFLCVAGYLMLLGLAFIGLSYLLVYVGAVSILFLFILMLINIRISEIISSTSNSIPLAVFISSIFLFTISPALPLPGVMKNNLFAGLYKYYPFSAQGAIVGETPKKFIAAFDAEGEINGNKDISFKGNSTSVDLDYNNFFSDMPGNVYSNAWDNLLSQSSYINTLGNVLYTNFPLWIILTSLVLLLAMVGCILITVKN